MRVVLEQQDAESTELSQSLEKRMALAEERAERAKAEALLKVKTTNSKAAEKVQAVKLHQQVRSF